MKEQKLKLDFKIESEKDLEKVLDYISSQGFGSLRTWDLHKRKIENLIDNNNTLDVKYDSNIASNLYYDKRNYDEMDKELKQYFSKFSSNDKINEYINKFRLVNDGECMTPYNSPSRNDIIKWVKFKKRFNLTDEFGTSNYIYVYNLDKKSLKLYFGDNYNKYDFMKFYKIIFNEDVKNELKNTVGVWQDLGKIEAKHFQNGNIEIKGDISKIKEYYYNNLKDEIYNHTIIRYNKKTEILKQKEN